MPKHAEAIFIVTTGTDDAGPPTCGQWSPLMQPVTMPVLPSLRGSFAKVKAKSPGWHPRSRSRRARSIACLILIFFQNFRGKPCAGHRKTTLSAHQRSENKRSLCSWTCQLKLPASAPLWPKHFHTVFMGTAV